MLRNHLPLLFLSACLLGASASRADEVGYIDCTNHPDDTQVAAKAAKTQETVGALPCGERFTILQSGFFFSRIQTKEGKVGYVYTNLISHEYSGNAAPQQTVQAVQTPAKMAARSSNPLSAIAAAFKSKNSAPAESLRVPPPPTAPAAKPATAQASAAVSPVKTTPAAQAPPAPAQSAATQEPTATSAFPPKSGVVVLNETPATADSQPQPIQPAAPPMNVATAKVGENFSVKSGMVVQNETPASAKAQSKTVQTAAAKPPVATNNFSSKSGVVVQTEAASAQSQPKPAQSAAVKPPMATDNFSANSGVVVENERSAVRTPEPVPSQVAPVPVATADINPPAVSVRLEPEPIPPAQPEPSVAANFQPETPARPMQKTSGGGHHIPSIELFGGYSFARLDSGAGAFTNYSGGMGAVALNLTRWLQVTGDSSYNMLQSSGTKYVVYGNHYGPRLFWSRRNRWNVRPFVEGLFGGTRVDTTVSGTGGYSASVRAFSMKVGGGLDIRPSRHIEIRLFDADYYRTSFPGAATPYQSNYWISTGVVLRLFGGGSE